MEANIVSIATGISKTYGKEDNTFQSAYKKDQFFNFVEVNELGLNGDFQVDKRYHGGENKAIHIGSIKHFDNFKNIYNKELDKLAIGCNIFIDNYDESDICIGDIYTIGDIEVEVSEPRQPCWKIGAIFDKETSRYIAKNNATGWYVRVLNGGTIDINDKMVLKTRVSDITVKELSFYLHETPKDKELIDNILNIKPLSQSYKDSLNRALNLAKS